MTVSNYKLDSLIQDPITIKPYDSGEREKNGDIKRNLSHMAKDNLGKTPVTYLMYLKTFIRLGFYPSGLNHYLSLFVSLIVSIFRSLSPHFRWAEPLDL